MSKTNFFNFSKVIASLLSISATIIGTTMIGVIGGSISGAILGFVTGIIIEIPHYTSIGDIVFVIFSYIMASIFTFGIPLGGLVGLITATHFKFFRLYSITSFFWSALTFLSVVFGLWFSSFRNFTLSQDVVIYLEIAITSFVAGWASHKYSDFWARKENISSKNFYLTLTGSMLGAIIISSTTCFYFTLMEYLRNIPS